MGVFFFSKTHSREEKSLPVPSLRPVDLSHPVEIPSKHVL